MKKFKTRNAFLNSVGAQGSNLRWAWSWVNRNTKSVYFGANILEEEGPIQLILSKEWEFNKLQRRNPGYGDSLKSIRLVEEQGYRLFTFRHKEKLNNPETGSVKITDFEQEFEPRSLVVKSDGWYATSSTSQQSAITNTEVDKPFFVFLEGSKIPIAVHKIERSAQARAACLDIHGTICHVCKFDFQVTYGDLGEGFIHVHHLNPISENSGERTVSPKHDLRPVCPNCHAMIHRHGQNLPIEELKEIMRARQ